MATIKKPNTICRNNNCKNGVDGGRKVFFACKSCLRNENWRSFCCCEECFNEYVDAVEKERALQRSIDLLPERIDMTKEEIVEYMSTPIEVAANDTKEELAEYIAENPESSITEVVKIVNSDIDKKNKRKRN